MDDLIAWKNSETRKQLILKGEMQVDKMYILKQFGNENYKTVTYFKRKKDFSSFLSIIEFND